MAQQIGIHEPAAFGEPTPFGRGADAFVIFSVTVLSLALGAWLLQRMGLTLGWGLVTSLGIYVVLLAVHLLVRRSITSSATATHGEHDEFMWDEADPLAAEAEQLTAHVREEEVTGALGRDAAGEDPFAFRPTTRTDPLFERGGPTLDGPGKPAGGPQSDMSVEVIQGLIKKLADEINSTPGRGAPDKPAHEAEAMIGRSVEALETTARSMRGQGPAAADAPSMRARAAEGPSGWWPSLDATPNAGPGAPNLGPDLRMPPNLDPGMAPPPPPAGSPPSINTQLARIAEAIAADRMEVLLEPIHALAEGRPRHFEISVRLLTADGEALEQADLPRIALGTGLMPRIDAARMVRAIRVARRLGERGREGSVLASVAGESLTDEQFLGTAATSSGSGNAMRLVLSFAQAEVRMFTPGHVEALQTLASAGFDFALEQVTDLDMDFSALKAIGFRFVELDAPVFLEGMTAAGGRIPASDICRHLADFGLTLIVGRIEDDWLLARILGFGVLLGKGTLFGGPKLVKSEVVQDAA